MKRIQESSSSSKKISPELLLWGEQLKGESDNKDAGNTCEIEKIFEIVALKKTGSKSRTINVSENENDQEEDKETETLELTNPRTTLKSFLNPMINK